jgi:hypothetical protein
LHNTSAGKENHVKYTIQQTLIKSI